MRRVVVTGAGGFIGSHLVSFLKARGEWVRGVDIKAPEFGPTDADDFDRRPPPSRRLPRGPDRRRGGVCAGGRHGGDGLHLEPPQRDPAQQRPHQPAHAGGRAKPTALRGTCTRPRRASIRSTSRRRSTSPRSGRRMRTRPPRRTPTAGRSSSRRRRASTTASSKACRPGSFVSTTSTDRWARSRAAWKRHRLRFAGRWRGPPTPGRSRSGVTASRPAASATSTTAWRASTASCDRIMRSR